MQTKLCLFTERSMEVSGERTRQAGSWGKGSNMQVWDTGQGFSLPVRYIKIQNSPSQTSTASLLLSLAETSASTSAVKAQLPSPLCMTEAQLKGGTGWQKPIPTVFVVSKTLISPIFTYKKDNEPRDCCKSGRLCSSFAFKFGLSKTHPKPCTLQASTSIEDVK